MVKNRFSQSLKPFHIGIDARLAFRRGVGTYTANLILSLSRIDHKNRYSIFNAPASLKKQVKNHHFHFVDAPFSNAAFYEQVLLPRKARARGVDFLHYTDNSATALDPMPFVVTLHDTMHTRPLAQVRSKPTFRHRLVYGYKKWAIARSAPRARAVLTISEFSKGEILNKLDLNPERVFVTPEGVDRQFFKAQRAKGPKLFNILVHGAADERKNLSNILKAAKILADRGRKFQLVVVGMDAEEISFTHYLEEEMVLRLGDKVEWAGNVPGELLPQVYSEADVFLYPSRLEGFGLPVLEAFSCGVPVITSNTTSLPEVAGDAALLVDPENPEAMAKAVERIMDKPAIRRGFIRKGFLRARKFSWENTARKTLEVYERMREWI